MQQARRVRVPGGVVVLRRLFQRPVHAETQAGSRKSSVFIRHLDGGSSNASELELTALENPIYDLAQYGIRFVASPRHADVLLMTGPLTRNMLRATQQAFAVMPDPKSIITVGDFADFERGQAHGDQLAAEIDGLFSGSYATVDLPEELRAAIVAHIPGDPPEPRQIIEVLLSVARKVVKDVGGRRG